MKVKSHYLQIIRECKSILLRFVMLIFGLLIIQFSQAQVGTTCSNAIQIQQLPYSHSGDIIIYGNNYGGGNVPSPINNPYSNTPFIPGFLEGPEVVYRFIPEVDGFVDLSFSSTQLFSSLWVFVDCPFTATIGWDYKSSGYDREILNLRVYAGETYYFVLSSSKTSANYSFDFEVKKTTPGKKCEVPLQINSLPYMNTAGINYFGNDYDYTDMPPAAPDAIHTIPYDSSYLNGHEIVYAYTPSANGYVNASLYSGSGIMLYVFTGCPFQWAIGWDRTGTGQYSYVSNIKVVAGQTYYFVAGQDDPLGFSTTSFSLSESEGLICEKPFQVSGFPFSANGDVSDRNDYDQNDVPPVSPGAIHNLPYNDYFLRGSEVVFAYTAEADEYIDASSTATIEHSSLWVFTGCPFQSTIGWDYSPGLGGSEIKEIPVLAGETYYFVLSGYYPNEIYSYTFNLKKSHGVVCESPLEIESLPFSHQGQLSEYENDYSTADIPPLIPNPKAASTLFPERINGYDVVYAYTPESDQFVNATVNGDKNFGGLLVLTGCPFELLHGWDTYASSGLLEINDMPLQGGMVYYFVVCYTIYSSFDYTFELTEASQYDCPVLEKNVGDECSDGVIATVGDQVTEDCECVGFDLTASAVISIPQTTFCGKRIFRIFMFMPNTNRFIIGQSTYKYISETTSFAALPAGIVHLYIEIEGALSILLEDVNLTTEGVNLIELNDIILGDLNADNVINFTDFSLFGAAFGSIEGDENYNKLADLNCDSSINFTDFTLFGANYGAQGVSAP